MSIIKGDTESGAIFSECEQYRYALWRCWNKDNGIVPVKYMVSFIGLNPSTATHEVSDPTVTRCINYAKAWGYSGMHMLNLFAFRATDPKDMKAVDEPVGEDNNEMLIKHARDSGIVIASWGNHGGYRNRCSVVADLMRVNGVDLHCLAIAKTGQPKHPLYLKKDLTPIDYLPGAIGETA